MHLASIVGKGSRKWWLVTPYSTSHNHNRWHHRTQKGILALEAIRLIQLNGFFSNLNLICPLFPLILKPEDIIELYWPKMLVALQHFAKLPIYCVFLLEPESYFMMAHITDEVCPIFIWSPNANFIGRLYYQ